MYKFAQITIINSETNEEIFLKSLEDVSAYFGDIKNALSQISNLRCKASNTAKIGNFWYHLKGETVNKKIYKIKDLLSGEIIESHFLDKICEKIGCAHSEVLRLCNRKIKGRKANHIKSRYINPEDTKPFVLVEEGGLRYECISPLTLFLHLNIKYEENLGKAISAVIRGIHKTVNVYGKIFKLIGEPKPPREISKEEEEKRKAKKLNRKIGSSLRSNLRERLRGKSKKSDYKTFEILGCSIEEFKEWIQNQFEDGMSWDNMGSSRKNGCKSWHIDHIVPCNLFDLTRDSEIKICFNYKNTRPLWEEDNAKRPKNGSDLDPEILIAAKRC